MQRQRRRPMHYTAICLHDGTVLSAFPIRKPIPKTIKQEKLKIDEDGVCRGHSTAGEHISDVNNDNRTRFQDIIATRINTRRTIREIVLPAIHELKQELTEINDRLNRIENMLSRQSL